MSIDLTDGQIELLSIISEECGEVSQAVSKIIRFGLEGRDPKIRNANTNKEELAIELGNVMSAMMLASKAGLLDYEIVKSSAKNKMATVLLNHQEDE